MSVCQWCLQVHNVASVSFTIWKRIWLEDIPGLAAKDISLFTNPFLWDIVKITKGHLFYEETSDKSYFVIAINVKLFIVLWK